MAASAEEIEHVYARRYEPFRRAIIVLSGDERSHDAVQEGFAKALAKRRQFKGGSLEAWIWRIVVRQAFDVRRRPAPYRKRISMRHSWSQTAIPSSRRQSDACRRDGA
jgi:DNA-directed RNA polymerase specialized sigma24 family protein